jgi:hypothetical protein
LILSLAIGLLAVIVLVVFLHFWVRRPEKIDAMPADWTEYSQVCSGHGPPLSTRRNMRAQGRTASSRSLRSRASARPEPSSSSRPAPTCPGSAGEPLHTHDKVVEGLELSGDDTTCPYSVDARATDVFSWPSDAQWEQAIGRYVDGGA